MNVNRRQFIKLAGGAAIIATLPKALPAPGFEGPNVVSFTVSGLDVGDRAYATVIDANGNSISEVYEAVRYVTRKTDGETTGIFEVAPEYAGRDVCIAMRKTSEVYEALRYVSYNRG